MKIKIWLKRIEERAILFGRQVDAQTHSEYRLLDVARYSVAKSARVDPLPQLRHCNKEESAQGVPSRDKQINPIFSAADAIVNREKFITFTVERTPQKKRKQSNLLWFENISPFLLPETVVSLNLKKKNFFEKQILITKSGQCSIALKVSIND